MGSDLLITILPWAVGALVLIAIIISLVFNVSGTWERVPSDQELAAAHAAERTIPRERIVLGQIGPLVRGRRELPGGHQEFSGFIIFSTARIVRRDHGVASLVKQGFPEAIAKLVNGDVTGKLKLKITSAGLFLEGSFTPQKIEFTHRPPQITQRYFLKPLPRRYRRLTVDELVVAEERVVPTPKVEEQPTS